MTQFLIAIHRPYDYNPALMENEAMAQEIDRLNEEMQSKGIIIFVGGLQGPDTARSVQLQPNGEILINQRLYLNSYEHVGGFWILETASLEEALNWAQKAAMACRAPVEVRPFH